MEAITYSLRLPDLDPKEYYKQIKLLTKNVIEGICPQLLPLVFASFETSFIPSKTPIEQCFLELLLLGIYARREVSSMHNNRNQHLEIVLCKLDQSGDFKFHIKRLRYWQAFLNDLSPKRQRFYWKVINKTVDEFAKQAEAVLGVYTKNVEQYLAVNKPLQTKRTDAFFCASPRLEYYINMVGAEILNQILRKQFLATKQKVVVLPGCMRSNPKNCHATEAILGFKCQHCTPNCQVSLITEMGKVYDFKVLFVIHQSALATHVENLHKLNDNSDLGIIGVACVLSLLEGGYMLMDNGVPTQCVVLDYCGCTNHWHPKGIATRIDNKQLLEVLKQ